MATYSINPMGLVVLVLTPAEARGLLAFADEGAQGLLSDAEALKAYVGTKPQVQAAERALGALTAACTETRKRKRK